MIIHITINKEYHNSENDKSFSISTDNELEALLAARSFIARQIEEKQNKQPGGGFSFSSH